MARPATSTKKQAITKEIARLHAVYKDIDKNKNASVEGLIQRAAFMRVSLAELEEDLDANGFVEWFSQGDQEPYQRERPTTRIYSTMNTGYQKIIKQLSDLLPAGKVATTEGDGFDNFVYGREDN